MAIKQFTSDYWKKQYEKLKQQLEEERERLRQQFEQEKETFKQQFGKKEEPPQPQPTSSAFNQPGTSTAFPLDEAARQAGYTNPITEAQKGTNRSTTINEFNTTNTYENANLPDFIKEQFRIINNPDATAEAIRKANLEIGKYNIGRTEAGGPGTLSVQREQELGAEAQRLSSQLGQYGNLPVEATGFDYERGIITGLRDAIPRAISFAGAGAAAGGIGVGAATGGVGAPVGAVIGAAAGFSAGLISSMFSEFKSQRVEDTNAQKRVLDEGKQILNDWATVAASDPSRRAIAVRGFNQQLARIDQAYRQMKLDTSRDVLKFESAIPDLAEFEEFYALSGERDHLVTEMRMALMVQQDPEYIYRMQELAQRRGIQ